MTDIEQKALALVDEVRAERGYSDVQTYPADRKFPPFEALCRAIEQHEAFRREVSEAVESLCNTVLMSHGHRQLREMLSRRFIIAKPDPLVDAFASIGTIEPKYAADNLRAALAARGLEIVKKEPSQ